MSSSIKIGPENMAAAVGKIMSEYTSGVATTMKDAIKETGKETVKQLRKTSPKRTGEYAKGWKQKVLFENSHEIRLKVYNKDRYRLTHLLENGHRASGINHKTDVSAHPHIQSAADAAADKVMLKIKRGGDDR